MDESNSVETCVSQMSKYLGCSEPFICLAGDKLLCSVSRKLMRWKYCKAKGLNGDVGCLKDLELHT